MQQQQAQPKLLGHPMPDRLTAAAAGAAEHGGDAPATAQGPLEGSRFEAPRLWDAAGAQAGQLRIREARRQGQLQAGRAIEDAGYVSTGVAGGDGLAQLA